MDEQTIFWSVIMLNGFFILAFMGHLIRTIIMKKSIYEINLLMYIAIIVLAVFFNLVCLDKIGKEVAQVLISSMIGIVFGAVGNSLITRRKNQVSSNDKK